MFTAQATHLTGAGASFPAPLYAKWAADYAQITHNTVNYQSLGSGAGQEQIIAKTVDFGASDEPMPAETLKKHGLLQFPTVIGGVVPIVNLPGIKAGELKLSGQLLAKVFLGKIKKWNDADIRALNPTLQLPATDIIVIHRADGSGTTAVWTHYLSQVSREWHDKVGVGKAVKWPTGHGGKGNEGVATYVRLLKNSIGYVEYAYTKQGNLTWPQLLNQSGKFVSPTQNTFAAAAAHANWQNTPGMGVLLTNEPGLAAWPITAATFILIPKIQDQPQQGKAVLSFFDWAFKHGAPAATALDYVPLQKNIAQEIRRRWQSEVRTTDNKPIWP
jgi:phosphate transport system substrate-binding protein